MNKTIIIFSFLTFLFAGRLSAQAPAHINYQAALRNTETGVELSNQQVFMVVKFLDGGPGGEIVYQEEHDNVNTSLYGIINIQLGNGNPVQGNFSAIPWESGDIWLDLEVDAGKGLQSIGTTKFSSVPYALYAADAPQAEPDGDGDSTNEIQDLIFSDNVLTISNNNSASTIDLSGYVNTPDDDSDPTNEIQDISLTGNTLRITGNTQATDIDLSPYVNVPDADSDPANELITAFEYNPVTAIISIIEGGDTLTQDLSTLAGGGGPDADADPTNEIQDLSLSGNILKITGNLTATNINLSPYVNVPNLDNDPANEIQDLSFTGGTLKITGNSSATNIDLSGFTNVPNLDNDPANEIQDLVLTGNNLKISGNSSATDINLGAYRQDLSLTGNTLKITGNPSATNINLSPYVNVPNLDNDPANEIQDLNLTGTTLKITGNSSATNIDLSGFTNVPNLDNNPTNEIQDLNLTGTTLKITGNSSATNIDLSTYKNVPNLDNNPTNEIQDLNLTGTTLKITGNSSATNIDLSTYKNVPNLDNDPANEIQDLSFTGGTLKITGNSSATNIDLSGFTNVPNLDNDPANEIQDLNLTGTTLKITGNSSATNIDLSTYKNVANLDNDPANEIQDLNLTGNTLKITGNLSATNIDLSPYQNQPLPQGQIFVGNTSNVATPRSVTGDLSLSDAGVVTVSGLRGIPISTTAPTDGQKLAYDSGTNTWVPVSDASVSASTKYYSVDPMDFVELNDPDGYANLNKHNGLKFFNESAPFAMLRNESIRKIGAPVHLPHGAEITEIKFYIKDSGPGIMRYSIERKQLTNYSTGNTILASGLSSAVSGNSTQTFNVNSNNVVNNQLYSYRVFVSFSVNFDEDDEDDPDDVEQVVYGIVISYTE
ncbi:hypothetical protein G3O08_16635 [Cryomorpha ignava]|uniref:Uncharacterized protein n=1 Tax=Cryomorpha ignava TaxID=101383 RepID=A0A7K3WTX0_9FLAO|nr:hypothetical protein [Cryomorpha ignava]NEN25129.1 hypothetical protein [Cryomorpha ignava]